MSPTEDSVADFIASHSGELAIMAERSGHATLAYALRIAELEARTLSKPVAVMQKGKAVKQESALVLT